MRPDLTLVEAGALDPLSATTIPRSSGEYPLSTRLRNGAQVTVDEAVLEPLLQQALQRLEEQDVWFTLLLCAGTFGSLRSNHPLLTPFTLVNGLLQAAGIRNIGVICPFADQELPIRARWRDAGFQVQTGTASLADTLAVDALLARWLAFDPPLEAVVLDYVGHDPMLVRKLQSRFPLPIFDLGLTSMTVLVHTVPGDSKIAR